MRGRFEFASQAHLWQKIREDRILSRRWAQLKLRLRATIGMDPTIKENTLL